MASDQQFCLRWNNHQSTLVSVFDNLLESQTLVDCTLAADGQYLKAHKVVLSACSPYLEAILCQNLDKHPILILKDVKFSELKAMLDYMYRGEVNISQEQLSTFLKAAESLQIKGLTDSGGGGSSERDREREPLKRQDLRKPLTQPVPHIPQPRPVVPHPGLMERRSLPHFPPHIADMQPQSPRHAREGSTSPTARKRRRPNRPSSDDSNFVSTPNSLSENQPDTSDSCDVPVKQAAPSTPNVPNATTKAPETDSNRTTPQPQNNQQNSEQKQQVTVKKEFSEALLTPKTEFDYGNDNSMEDVTYEDDEEEEVDLSKPGTSFAANSQGFPPWQMGGDGSNDDSNNMYSPDVTAATNQNNSQDFADNSATKQNENIKQSNPKSKQIDKIGKQILKLTKELALIVNRTPGRFTEQSVEREEPQKVSETETNYYSQTTSDNLNISCSALVEEHLKRELEYDDLENGNNAIFDTDNSQLREQRNKTVVKTEPLHPLDEFVPFILKTEKSLEKNVISKDCQPVAELLSLVLKSEESLENNLTPEDLQPVAELLPLVLKTDKSFENSEPPAQQEISTVSFFDERENSICSKCNLPSDIVNHVCLFKCDLCTYTAKYNTVLGQHKWRVHKITSKSSPLCKKKLSVFGRGKIFQCNICPYKARSSQIIGQHKRRVHEIVGIRSASLIEKPSTGDDELADNNGEKLNQETIQTNLINQKEYKRVTRTQSSKDSSGKESRLNSSYGTVTKDTLRAQKWRKHDSHNNAGNITPSSSKVVMKCDLCSYKTRYVLLLNWHKKQEHKVSEKTDKDKIETSSDKTSAPEKYIDVENQNHPGSSSENKPTEELPNLDDSRTVKYECDFCSYTSTSKDGFRLHSKRKHGVKLKPSADGYTLITTKTNEKKSSKKSMKFKKQCYNFRGHIKLPSNSSATSSATSSAAKGNLSKDHFSGLQDTTAGFMHDMDSNKDKFHVQNVFENDVLKRDSTDIMDDGNFNSMKESYKTSAEDLSPEPVRVDSEALDEDCWIDIEEGETELCPKCNLSFDPNNHACLFKCDLCSFTSKCRKIIVKHKLLQHKVAVKPKNQSVTGNVFKCDLCSYTSRYIQSIGKHKRKIHNVLGQASEKFLMKKKCILGSKKGKLFKCEYCSFTAKYIQNIGTHKKREHKPEDKPVEELATTPEPERDIVNRLYKNRSKDAFKERKLDVKRKIKRLTGSADAGASSLKEKIPSHTSKMRKAVSGKIVVFPKNIDTSSEDGEAERTTRQSSAEGDKPLEIVEEGSLNKGRKVKKKTKSGETQSQADSEAKKFKCKSCSYHTNIIAELRMHRWRKHKDGRKIKNTRDQAGKEQGARRIKIDSQGRFICRCKKIYKNKTSLYQHLRYHCMQEPRQCCYLCSYKTHRRSEVLRHLRQVHKLNIPQYPRKVNIDVE